jgi:calcium-dependent protein kinase
LSHPNILKVFEFFEDAHNFHLVTEVCTGGELLDYIASVHDLNERLLAGLMKQVISAIAHCHEHRVVHRDINPQNLLLQSEPTGDSNPVLKVIDFGTVGLVSEGKHLHRKMKATHYMAPEVLKGSYDAKCDVWSLGVVLYVILCGRVPFEGSSEEEIQQAILEKPFRYRGRAWTTISEEAKDLVKRMLVKKPKHRYSAADALAHPWIAENVSTATDSSEQVIKQTVSRLRQFNATRKL